MHLIIIFLFKKGSHLRLPVRLVAAGWFLAGFVLINAYSSTLISYLMTLRYYPTIDSIEDIASTQRPVFMVTKSTSYETAVLVRQIYKKNCNSRTFFIKMSFKTER